MKILDADATARALDWPLLIEALEATILDHHAGQVNCPPRTSVPLPQDAVWLLMPAWSSRSDIAACKLITVHPRNADIGLPVIQGDILVIRVSTGERLALLDGPTVTARRTAAISALAIRRIREARAGGAGAEVKNESTTDGSQSCLIIGCGVQGRSHMEALHATLPGTRFTLTSRSADSAKKLAARAAALGIQARVVARPEDVLADVDIIACCTPAIEPCLNEPPRDGAIIAAVGSFKPHMSELGPAVMRSIGRNILLDTADARHESGELQLAGIDLNGLPTLLDWDGSAESDALPSSITDTVLFKSCGSALWDLAAAQAAVSTRS